MKKIIAIISLALFIPGVMFAQVTKTHTDKKAKFSIKHPPKWSKKVDQGDINVIFASPDNLANVQVVKAVVDEKIDAKEFLSQVEQAAGGRTNQVPEEHRAAEAADLKKMNADEGAMGVYQIEQEGTKINQLIAIVRKGKIFYSIIVTFAAEAEGQYKDIVTKMADSFVVLK